MYYTELLVRGHNTFIVRQMFPKITDARAYAEYYVSEGWEVDIYHVEGHTLVEQHGPGITPAQFEAP